MRIKPRQIGSVDDDDITAVSTNTMTVMGKKKRKHCEGDANTTTVMKKKYLPYDLIAKEILTRLPVRTLQQSVLVSKLWYNTIHNDHKRFTTSHFLESQKRPEVVFSLLNVRDGVAIGTDEPTYGCHFFRFTTGIYSRDDNVLRFDRFKNSVAYTDMLEVVGYCNGLPCLAQTGKYSGAYVVLDPNRKDFVCMFYPVSTGKCISRAHIICHGFGFDQSAKEYKVVSIYGTIQEEINVLVFTLGTKSWRNVTATSMPISGPGGRPITKIRPPTFGDKSAIFCRTGSSSSSGCLAWKIIATLGGAGSDDIQHDNSNAADNEMEMLLSFNLHNEKFQFIQLPPKSTTNDQKDLLVDYPHLLEFKGSPCVARIDSHGCRDGFCCCKVHLYVLKDKVKQVWVKEESFDVRISSTPISLADVIHLAPESCCFCFSSTTTPPTRIFSFSDQVLLYRLNGKQLQTFNLRSGELQLVLPSYPKEDVIFEAKIKEPRHIYISGDDDIYCSNMDYQLHCHEENFLSLQTFIPEGVEGGDITKLKSDCSAFVVINRGSRVYYPFYD